jgi:(S)-mandelate dehydrogenase
VSPARVVNIADLRALAHRRLPRLLVEFLEGGAEEHVTVRANRDAFESIGFAPRTLVDVSRRSQKTALLGGHFDCPFGIAPVGAAALYWREADIALARAARSANVPFVLSAHSFVSLERVVHAAGAPPWSQLYLCKEREATARAVKRAFDAGCEVLVLTTDVPVGGNREYNERNGFGIPLRLNARNLLDGLAHFRWLSSVVAPILLGCSSLEPLPEWGTRRDAATWDDLAWLRERWPRKLLVKGILSIEDAQLAAQHGADGIVVSNHGGRQLDGAPSALEMLPQIAAAAGSRLAVLVDGGFRRGSDIVKALALGADMVLLGRAAMYGVAALGEPGAHLALQILRSEVDRVLALLGCPSPAQLDARYLRFRAGLAAGPSAAPLHLQSASHGNTRDRSGRPYRLRAGARARRATRE